jgi:hypothetical protein
MRVEEVLSTELDVAVDWFRSNPTELPDMYRGKPKTTRRYIAAVWTYVRWCYGALQRLGSDWREGCPRRCPACRGNDEEFWDCDQDCPVYCVSGAFTSTRFEGSTGLRWFLDHAYWELHVLGYHIDLPEPEAVKALLHD